jgi:putative transposase
MPHRVSPTDRVRGHIDELFASGRPLPEILEDVARLGAQLLMQAALEAEITEFLGRDRYQRAAACADARPGSRNGYREVTVKTTAGPDQDGRPSGRSFPFFFGISTRRTGANRYRSARIAAMI